MKVKSLILLMLMLIAFIACETSVQPPKPENLIPKGKMQNVLYDMFIINSAKGINKKLLENNGLNPEDYVLEKYNIDSLQFAQSNDFYAHDIEAYQEIINEVKRRITTEKSRIEKKENEIKEREKKRRDSLKKANAKKISQPIGVSKD